MSAPNAEHERWLDENNRYLAAALRWLRLRLERVAETGPEGPSPLAPRARAAPPAPAAAAPPPTLPEPPPVIVKRRRWRRDVERPMPEPTIVAPAPAAAAEPEVEAPTSRVTDDDVAAAEAAMVELGGVDHPPALVRLARLLGLSRFERDVLLLCAGLELDTRVGLLCARAQGDHSAGHATFALALSLFDDPVWEALSPERPLRYWWLVETHAGGSQPLTTSPLRADGRIVNYLKGLNHLDERLRPLLAPVPEADDAVALPPSQARVIGAIVNRLSRAASPSAAPVIHLLGRDAISKRLIAAKAASELGSSLVRLPVESLPASASDLDTTARLWQRESALLPLALYLDAHDVDDGPADSPAAAARRFLGRVGGVVFLDSRDVWAGLDGDVLLLDVSTPTPGEQRQAWADALGEEAGGIPAVLAGQFNLSAPTIRQLAAAVPVDDGSGTPRQARLWAACLASTRPRLEMLAQRIDARASWDDIVLPDKQTGLLRQISSQVGQRSTVYDEWGFGQRMNRGLGITALFAGESGTGKTMAAEVIANDLRLDLYRIDLSAVVSKYIGETEKNLRKVFDAAEDGGAILFFDEADALFGKRSEVKDSHDRYANIEINYLLQRMEAYRGLAVLATNMKSALDQAFARRLRFIVDFPFPGRVEREAIWRAVFPPAIPSEGLDFRRLARLNLSGGSIHNVALNAAFLAAAEETPVTMPLVLRAAHIEFTKLDKPVNEADFRWDLPNRRPA